MDWCINVKMIDLVIEGKYVLCCKVLISLEVWVCEILDGLLSVV